MVSKGKVSEVESGNGSKIDEDRSSYDSKPVDDENDTYYGDEDTYYGFETPLSPLIHIPPSPVQLAKPTYSVAPTLATTSMPDKPGVRFSDLRVSALAILEHLSNPRLSRKQEKLKSRARSGADRAVTGLAGVDVAGSHEHGKAQEDQEKNADDRKAELVFINEPREESSIAYNFTSEEVIKPLAGETGLMEVGTAGSDEVFIGLKGFIKVVEELK